MRIWLARREHFDLDAAMWWIPRSKSGKPRTVPLHEVALRELRAFAKVEPEAVRIFTMKTPESLTYHFRDIRSRAGIDTDLAKGQRGLGLHDLRRTAATRATQAGVLLPTVMFVLGHSGLGATDHYVVVTAEHARAFADAL